MQQNINTGKADILVIGLPKDAGNSSLQKDECGSYLVWKRSTGAWNCSDNLPEGNLTLLGTYPDNLTEEMAARVVDNIFDKHFFNYLNPLTGDYAPGYTLETALQSFATLMEANQCFVENPYGKRPDFYINEDFGQGKTFYDEEDFDNQLAAWELKQSRTFDKWAVVLIDKK